MRMMQLQALLYLIAHSVRDGRWTFRLLTIDRMHVDRDRSGSVFLRCAQKKARSFFFISDRSNFLIREEQLSILRRILRDPWYKKFPETSKRKVLKQKANSKFCRDRLRVSLIFWSVCHPRKQKRIFPHLPGTLFDRRSQTRRGSHFGGASVHHNTTKRCVLDGRSCSVALKNCPMIEGPVRFSAV